MTQKLLTKFRDLDSSFFVAININKAEETYETNKKGNFVSFIHQDTKNLQINDCCTGDFVIN